MSIKVDTNVCYQFSAEPISAPFPETKLGKHILENFHLVTDCAKKNIINLVRGEIALATAKKNELTPQQLNACIEIKIEGIATAGLIRPWRIKEEIPSEARVAKLITSFNDRRYKGLFDYVFPRAIEILNKETPALMHLVKEIEQNPSVYTSRLLQHQIAAAIYEVEEKL